MARHIARGEGPTTGDVAHCAAPETDGGADSTASLAVPFPVILQPISWNAKPGAANRTGSNVERGCTFRRLRRWNAREYGSHQGGRACHVPGDFLPSGSQSGPGWNVRSRTAEKGQDESFVIVVVLGGRSFMCECL